MSRLRKRHLAAALAAIVVEAGGIPDHALQWMLKPVYGADDAAYEGFVPAACTGVAPPAELLALADWPLDPARGDCRRTADTVRETDASPVTNTSPAMEMRSATETVVTAIPDPLAIELEPLSPPPPHTSTLSRGDERPPALAVPSPRDPEPVLFSGTLVDDGALDGLRGGFETPGGLVMSFGVERLVYINGALTSMTRLNVADLGQLSGGGIDPAQLPSVGSTLAVIQNGPNNSFVADGLANGSFATVIQNSLNNQRIQAVTTINATVNSLDLMRANRLGESLRGAVSGAMIR